MKKLNVFFLAFFTVSVFSSQALMETSLVLLTLNLLAMLIKKEIQFKEIFEAMGFEYLWIAWVSTVALGYYFNAVHEAPWQSRMLEFWWIGALYFVWASLKQISIELKHVYYACIFFVLTLVYTLGSYFSGTDWFRSVVINRAGGPFGNPMTYAHMYALPFCILTGLLFSYAFKTTFKQIFKDLKSRPVVRWLLLATFFLGLSLVVSFTRGVWIGLLFGVVTMAFFQAPKLGVMVTLASILLVVGLYTTWQPFQDRVNLVTSEKSYDHERLTLWKTNWEIVKDYPVLGIGYNENARRLREYYDRLGVPKGYFESHAHNQFLHMWAGTGTLGLLIYLLIWFQFLKRSIRAFLIFKRLDRLRVTTLSDRRFLFEGLALGLIGAQVAFLFGSLTESNFEHAKIKYSLMLVWGLVLVLYKKARKLSKVTRVTSASGVNSQPQRLEIVR